MACEALKIRIDYLQRFPEKTWEMRTQHVSKERLPMKLYLRHISERMTPAEDSA